MYHHSDIPQWAEVKLSENEVPLKFVAESFNNGTGRFDIRQSKQVPNAWTVSEIVSNPLKMFIIDRDLMGPLHRMSRPCVLP